MSTYKDIILLLSELRMKYLLRYENKEFASTQMINHEYQKYDEHSLKDYVYNLTHHNYTIPSLYFNYNDNNELNSTSNNVCSAITYRGEYDNFNINLINGRIISL